jgi:hypothetical protein
MDEPMKPEKVYEEIVDFIAAGPTPAQIAAFHPSDAAKARVLELIRREKRNELNAEERSELDRFMQLEHLMRLVKAKVRT